MEVLRVAATLFSFICLVLGAKNRGDVILTGGPHSYAGYLQVYYNESSYGYVCDDYFMNNQNGGEVACRNLNRTFVSVQGEQTVGGGVYILDDVNCGGHETNLDQCIHERWGDGNCRAGEYVYITCDSPCNNATNCSQNCVEVNNASYICSCDPSYSLDNDGTTCNALLNATNERAPVIIDAAKYATLDCQATKMILNIKESALAGISLTDLQPLQQNCVGFHSSRDAGQMKYSIPLLNCGAEVKVVGDQVTFTNSLVYSSALKSVLKHFSQVILTHSCSYSLRNQHKSLRYTVRPKNYTVATKQDVDFQVSLNLSTDPAFRQLLNSGSISIKDGQHLFGNLGLIGGDPSRKIALNDCKVTPTGDADHIRKYYVIRNGCQTGYGVSVFSSKSFAIHAKSFVDHKGKNVYLHCDVVICDSTNMSRCQRDCPSSKNLNVVGRRDVELSPLTLVSVSAGPFFIQ